MLFSTKRVVVVSASSSSINTSASAPASSSSIDSSNTVSPLKTKPARRLRTKISACLKKLRRRPDSEPSASTPIEFECMGVTRDSWCLVCPAYVNAPQDSDSIDLRPAVRPIMRRQTGNFRSRAHCYTPIASSFLSECTDAMEVLMVADHGSVSSSLATPGRLFTGSNTGSEYGLLKESGLLSSDDSSSDDSEHEYDSVFIRRRIPFPSYPSSSNASCRRTNPMNSSYYPGASSASSSSCFGPSLDISQRDSLDYKGFMESQDKLLQKRCAALPRSFLIEDSGKTHFLFGSPPLNPSVSQGGSNSDYVLSHVAPRQGPSRSSTFLDSCLRQIQIAVTR